MIKQHLYKIIGLLALSPNAFRAPRPNFCTPQGPPLGLQSRSPVLLPTPTQVPPCTSPLQGQPALSSLTDWANVDLNSLLPESGRSEFQVDIEKNTESACALRAAKAKVCERFPAGYSEGIPRVFGGIRMVWRVFGSCRLSCNVAAQRKVAGSSPPKYHLV